MSCFIDSDVKLVNPNISIRDEPPESEMNQKFVSLDPSHEPEVSPQDDPNYHESPCYVYNTRTRLMEGKKHTDQFNCTITIEYKCVAF